MVVVAIVGERERTSTRNQNQNSSVCDVVVMHSNVWCEMVQDDATVCVSRLTTTTTTTTTTGSFNHRAHVWQWNHKVVHTEGRLLLLPSPSLSLPTPLVLIIFGTKFYWLIYILTIVYTRILVLLLRLVGNGKV